MKPNRCQACNDLPKPCDQCAFAVVVRSMEADSSPPRPSDPPRRIGRYDICEEIGRGGMGIVYGGYDESLRRLVAIKVLRTDLAARPDERFINEAKAMASLKHDHIVRVHETGVHEETPYFVMEYIEGESLAKGGMRHPMEAARFVCMIAKAACHAHLNGVFHRDITPSNVLIDLGGRAHLTDFGLAKQARGRSDQTVPGTPFGSPGFMSPEQARGDVTTLIQYTDVYGIGATLYYMLTGNAPFPLNIQPETLKAISEKMPKAPMALNPEVPRDLNTICLKCLEKTPNDRYRPEDLVADLELFLAGRPIKAQPSNALDHFLSWKRRNEELAVLMIGLVTTIVVTLPVATVVTTWKWRAEARSSAEYRRLLTSTEFFQAEQLLNANSVPKAFRSLRMIMDRESQGRDALDSGRMTAGLAARSRLLSAQEYRTNLQTVGRPMKQNKALFHLAVDPRERLLVTGGKDQDLFVWQPNSGNLLTVVSNELGALNELRFLNSSNLVVSGRAGGVGVWDLHGTTIRKVWTYLDDRSPARTRYDPRDNTFVTANESGWVTRLRADNGFVLHKTRVLARITTLEIGPGGGAVIVGTADGKIVVLENSGLTEIAQHRLGILGVAAIAIAGDNRSIACATEDGSLCILSPTGAKPLKLWKEEAGVTCLTFHSDGSRLIVGRQDGMVASIDAQTWAEATRVKLYNHDGPVTAVSISPSREVGISTSADGTGALWNPFTGTAVADPIIAKSWIMSCAFGRSGEQLYAGSFDGAIRTFSTEPRARTAVLAATRARDLDSAINSVAIDRHGRVYAGAEGGEMLCTQLDGPSDIPSVFAKPGDSGIQSIWARTDSDLTVVGRTTGSIQVFDQSPVNLRTSFQAHTGVVWQVEFAPRAQKIVSRGEDNLIRIHSTAGIPEVALGTATGNVGTGVAVGEMAVHEDPARGLAITFATESETAYHWNRQDGLKSFECGAPLQCVDASPDGEIIALGTKTGIVQLRRLQNGIELAASIDLKEPVFKVQFSPDGRFILAGTTFGSVFRLNAKDNLAPLLLGKLPDGITTVQVDPRSELAVATSEAGSAAAWTLETGFRITEEFHHPGKVFCATLTADGESLLTGCNDGKVRRWQLLWTKDRLNKD